MDACFTLLSYYKLGPTPIVLLRFTSRPWGVASLLRGWKREKAALRVERGVYMSYSAVCISRLQFDLCTIEPSTIGPSRTWPFCWTKAEPFLYTMGAGRPELLVRIALRK